jgi:GT2 family glycosyltransferase
MISVLLYGRNDAHGYNLHRRAALSLNCLAEILTDPDDEIHFVDYNTPDELPTFVEAIADTLTERCLELLRVLRVPAAVHAERFAARTHLPALEPVARNAAARRARPSNRWLLSTNTDMVFLPRAGRSLSEVCSDLPDGFYGLPRFELPEWLWERLPRSDPRRAMAELERLGPGLRLDETTVSHQWIRFDAPGDFQLILRDDFAAIDGFDEEMLLGWHVDSNLSRRMLFRREAIGSLDGLIAGYHCNHSRTPTVYHGAVPVMNDLGRFFASVDRADLPAQRETWGLADVELEEVPFPERVGLRFGDTVLAAIPAGTAASSDALAATYGLTYDSGHVLPFVADALAVSPAGATIAYVGANPVLSGMLGTLVDGLAPRPALAVADVADTRALDEVLASADVFVVDLGADTSLLDGAEAARSYDSARLLHAFAALDRLVAVERARQLDGRHPRRIVLVNASTMAMSAYVTGQLDSTATTIHSRVSRATVKRVPQKSRAARTAVALGRQLILWSIRTAQGARRLDLRPGESRRIADLPDYRAFGEGWAYPDEYGLWTRGEKAELAVAFAGVEGHGYRLAFSIRAVCLAPDNTLDIELVANGERVAGRRFPARHLQRWWVDLPVAVLAAGRADLAVVVKDPRSPLLVGWSTDDTRLGILISSVTLQRIRRTQVVTDRLHRAYLYVRASVGFRRHLTRLATRLGRDRSS